MHCTDAQLSAFLDESLPAAEMAAIERLLRDDPSLGARLAALCARRDSGDHSLGEIWRRERLTCPDREQLGTYLLGALDDEAADYVRFHVQVIGCRFCEANLADLRSRQVEPATASSARRARYFNSSAGRLRR